MEKATMIKVCSGPKTRSLRASSVFTLLIAATCAQSSLAETTTIFVDNDASSSQTCAHDQTILSADSSANACSGEQFPVVLQSHLSSKTARLGDPVQARLKYDLKIGDRLVASKGSLVQGHIDYAMEARTQLRSVLSKHRCSVTSGCLGIKFDEILNERDEHIPLVAAPARDASFVSNRNEGRQLGINKKGEIAGPYSLQVRNLAIRVALNAALSPVGVVSFGAAPVALGLIGAANPSFAYGRPVGYNVRHRRLKGFALAALSGVPGGFLIAGSAVKGEEVIVKPGDEFVAELRQDFSGQPAADAELLARVDAKVHGELIKPKAGQKSGS